MYFSCKSSVILIVGVLAPVACRVEPASVVLTIDEVRIDADTISFLHQQRKNPLNKEGSEKINRLISAISRAVTDFLWAILSPNFTGTEMAIRRESNSLKVTVVNTIEQLMRNVGEEERKQIKSVINFIKDNIYPDTVDKSVGKLSAGEITEHVNLLDKFFTCNHKNSILSKMVKDDWLVDIKSIKVNGLKLEEIIQIYSGLLDKNGLSWARRLFYQLLDEILKQ